MFSKEHPITTIISLSLICGTVLYVANVALACTGIICGDKTIIAEYFTKSNSKE